MRLAASGRVDEVHEVVTFVRWCGPMEPFPDAGRFDESRGGGSPVTCIRREASEPFEGGRGHARFAEPAAQTWHPDQGPAPDRPRAVTQAEG